MKGKSSCPMCRGSMCFRGMLRLKKEWHKEKTEEVYTTIITRIFDELYEEYGDMILLCIRLIQERYTLLMTYTPDITCESLAYILPLSWLELCAVRGGRVVPRGAMLFVGDTEYGVRAARGGAGFRDSEVSWCHT